MINGEFNTTVLSTTDLLTVYSTISECNFPSSHVSTAQQFLASKGYNVIDLIGANASSIVLRVTTVKASLPSPEDQSDERIAQESKEQSNINQGINQQDFAVKISICRSFERVSALKAELTNPKYSKESLPHALEIHEIFHDAPNDTLLVVMSLCLSGDIQSIINNSYSTTINNANTASPEQVTSSSIIPRETVLSLAMQMCMCVDELHDSSKIIHGDINPSNFLLTSEMQVKLAAHQSAKFLLNKAQQITADPVSMNYASKRQLQGLPQTTQDDLFSLAAIILDLCGVHSIDTLKCMRYDEILSASSTQPNHRQDLKDLFQIAVHLISDRITIKQAIQSISTLPETPIEEPLLQSNNNHIEQDLQSILNDSKGITPVLENDIQPREEFTKAEENNELKEQQSIDQKTEAHKIFEDEINSRITTQYSQPETKVEQEQQLNHSEPLTSSDISEQPSKFAVVISKLKLLKVHYDKAMLFLLRCIVTVILAWHPQLLESSSTPDKNKNVSVFSESSSIKQSSSTQTFPSLQSQCPATAPPSISEITDPEADNDRLSNCSSLSCSSLTLTSHRTNLDPAAQLSPTRSTLMPYECELTTNYLNTEEDEQENKNDLGKKLNNLSDCSSDENSNYDFFEGQNYQIKKTRSSLTTKLPVNVPRLVLPPFKPGFEENDDTAKLNEDDSVAFRNKNISLTERNNQSAANDASSKVDIIVFPNGYYIGQVKNKQAHGEGKMYFHKGNRYEGSFVDGLYEGKGIYYYAVGNKYVGQWKRNLREGRGMFKWANGTTYFGEYSKNVKSGNGTLKYKDGEKYTGMFKDNNFHGEGTYTFVDGARFQGSFENGERLSVGGQFFQPDGTPSQDPNYRQISTHRKVFLS